ncbi:MAG: hypothetical protein AAFO03_07445 [Bacteroidota bacterium]
MNRKTLMLLTISSILFVSTACRAIIKDEADEVQSIGTSIGQGTENVEQAALRIWDLMDENRFADLPLAVDALNTADQLEDLRERLAQPIDFQWKVIRGENNDALANYHYFISLPQYYKDPERRPFAQISCTINLAAKEQVITQMTVFLEEEVDQKGYDKAGVSPGLLSEKERYEIKNRTIRTVLDSLQAVGMLEDPISVFSNALTSLENEVPVERADFSNLIGYAFSENQFYLFKILLPYYNENVYATRGVLPRTMEDVNYLLREAMLEQIDLLIASDFNSVDKAISTGNACTATPTEAFSPEAVETIRSFIMEAELEMAIDRFQRLQIPEDIRNQLQLYCSANIWIEERWPLVREGVENYIKLLTMNSVIVSNMLDDLTALESR